MIKRGKQTTNRDLNRLFYPTTWKAKRFMKVDLNTEMSFMKLFMYLRAITYSSCRYSTIITHYSWRCMASNTRQTKHITSLMWTQRQAVGWCLPKRVICLSNYTSHYCPEAGHQLMMTQLQYYITSSNQIRQLFELQTLRLTLLCR